MTQDPGGTAQKGTALCRRTKTIRPEFIRLPGIHESLPPSLPEEEASFMGGRVIISAGKSILFFFETIHELLLRPNPLAGKAQRRRF